MEPSTMHSLVVALLAWIGAHTTYVIPDDVPAVAFVPHAYLEQLAACDEKCPVMGVYPDGNVVFLDDALQIDTNVCAQSVLLHELVHYLQNRDGKFLNLPAPLRSYSREHEAYSVQREFLAENGRKVAFGPNFYIGAFMGPSC